uniref:Si:dkey-159a18.1 n=1 Tax=Sander lucioperca TaxID=283035 RepID=A0A8C9YWQ2_SANLU
DGTGVSILVLHKILSFFPLSTDYAKSFHDISHRINNTFIREEFGVSVGPGSSRNAINLWLSLDFGANISYSCHQVLLLVATVDADERGDLLLKRTKDLGQTFTTIHEDIYSFGYIGAFLFFSVMEDSVRYLCQRGITCPQVLNLFDGDSHLIYNITKSSPFFCFNTDTFFGTMYTSDDRGILFSKSLARHLFDGQRKSDFTNITSLRGVYLTNKLDKDGRIRSVISFNRGGAWRQLNKPDNVECGEQVKNCNLHIHGEHSRKNNIIPMLALSEPTAIGLVIAHGTVGDSLSSSQHPDVFVSSDGGYNWRGTLRGPHHYSILDSGGLIVAVEAQREGQVKTIKFSTDEGQCWKSYNFTVQPFFFAGLASEPGTKAMNVSVWGFRPEEDGQPMWVAVTIDFQSNDQDYEEWLAHATDGGDLERQGCLLGVRETYRRLKKQSLCRNGRGFVVTPTTKTAWRIFPCEALTSVLFNSDYGYYRHVNTSECLRQHNAANKTLELCLNGEEDELLTAGYRKVPSDRCEGGFSPQLAVQTVINPCGVKTSPGPPARSSSPVTHFDTPVSRCVALMSVCVWLNIALYRSPVYRFSSLQIQDEANGIPADLESATSSNGTACLQDSDDVRVIIACIILLHFKMLF